MPRLSRTRLAAAAVLAASALAVSGCSALPVTGTYISDSKFGVWLAVPGGWQTFTGAQLGAPADDAGFLAGFGGPGVTPQAVLSGDSPGGVTRVAFAGGDFVAAQAAAGNVFLSDLSAAVASGQVQILEGPDVIAEDSGSRTIRWLLRLTLGPAAGPSTVQLISKVGKAPTGDAAEPVRVVKSLAVGCLDACFAANRSSIDTITESWRVS